MDTVFDRLGLKYPLEAKLLALAFMQAHGPDEIYAELRALNYTMRQWPTARLSGFLDGNYFTGIDWAGDDFDMLRDQGGDYLQTHPIQGRLANNPGGCGRGEIPIDRKGYTRRAHTRQDGTRVAATRVPRTTYCAPDRGRPGVTSFGAESGKRKGTKPLIQREGKLGGPGYTTKPQAERHKLLERCQKKYGYRSCLGSLQVLLNSSEIKGRTRQTLSADKKWLVGKYGGRKSNPDLEADELEPEGLAVIVAELDEGAYVECLCAIGFDDSLVGKGDTVAITDALDENAPVYVMSSDGSAPAFLDNPHERMARRLASGHTR